MKALIAALLVGACAPVYAQESRIPENYVEYLPAVDMYAYTDQYCTTFPEYPDFAKSFDPAVTPSTNPQPGVHPVTKEPIEFQIVSSADTVMSFGRSAETPDVLCLILFQDLKGSNL